MQPASFLGGILTRAPPPSPLPPALPCYHRSCPLPHIVHLSCKGFGGQFPLSSALAGPRLTGSASRDARLSSEAPGSGQYRPTSCRDNVTVTLRVCLPPTAQSPLPVRLHFIGREPRAKEGKSLIPSHPGKSPRARIEPVSARVLGPISALVWGASFKSEPPRLGWNATVRQWCFQRMK